MGCLLWLVLFAFSWPLALLFVILYPIIWLWLLPFRLLGITVGMVFDFLRWVILLPTRLVR
jgi:hypothetical protein